MTAKKSAGETAPADAPKVKAVEVQAPSYLGKLTDPADPNAYTVAGVLGR